MDVLTSSKVSGSPQEKTRVWMNEWLRKTAYPLVEADLRRVADLPGLDRVFVMPDTAADEFGVPNGVVFEADEQGAFIYPAAISDPNCGYLLAAVDLAGGVLDGKDLRTIGWRFIHKLLELGSGPPLFPLDLEGVMAGGASYVARELGEMPLARGGYVEDGGRVDGDLAAIPADLHDTLRDQFFHHLNYGHFLEVDVVDRVWSAADLDRFGLQEGSLVLIAHDGSARAGVEVFMRYHEEITLEAVRRGYFTPDDAASGMAGIPLGSSLGQECLRAVKAMENYAYARRIVALHLAGEALRQVCGETPQFTILSDRPHNKLERRMSPADRPVLVHRHGAQLVDSGLAVVCARPAVPNVLVAGTGAGKRAYCSHGAPKSPYLRGEMTFEDWRRLAEAPDVAVTNGQRCMWDALREQPMTLHLTYQNVLDAVGSLEDQGVVRRVARLWPLFNVNGTPKLLEAEEENV